MSGPDRLNHLQTLVAAFEHKACRKATAEEVAGIRRAFDRQDNVTAKLALGVIMDVNLDWPENHRRAALEAYGLEAAA